MIVIKNEQDYKYALEKLERLWDDAQTALPGSPDYDYFDFLCDAIQGYEETQDQDEWKDDGG